MSRLTPAAALLLPLLATGCRKHDFPDVPAGYREFAYVTNSTSNTVTVLDLVYVRPDRTLQVGENPIAITPNPKRDEVYAVNADDGDTPGSLSIIDTARNTVAATIRLERSPDALSVDPTGHRAYVPNTRSNTVSVLDLDARRVTTNLAVPAGPNAALIAPDGRSLVVTSGTASSISIYAVTPTAQPTLRFTIPDCPGASAPVILPDSSKAFVACSGSHHILAISLAAAPGTWAAQQEPALLADHVLALLDVGLHPRFLTLKPDGGEVFVSNTEDDTISELSTQTNEVTSTYPIGNRPTHGAVSADNSVLFVSNSGADSISVYSIDDGRLISGIHTGPGPDALAFSADEHLLLAADRLTGDVAVIRTASRLGPGLFTILPAGRDPSAIAIKAMQSNP